MKKVLLTFGVIILLSSCKKDLTCLTDAGTKSILISDCIDCTKEDQETYEEACKLTGGTVEDL